MHSTHSKPPLPVARRVVRRSGQHRWVGRWLSAAHLAAAVLLLANGPAAAQDPQWSANLVIQPFPSPFLSDWERNPQIAQLTVFYTGQNPADFRVELAIDSGRRGLIGRAVSGVHPVPFGPHTELLTNPEVVDWASMDYEEQSAELARRTGVLPEGEYEACTRIVDLQGQLRTEACAEFTIVLPEPPELISPANGAEVVSEQPVFQWTPIQVPPELGLNYRVRIVERLEGQTPQTALQANIPIHEAEVADVPLLVYPLDALPLEEGTEYVWQVEALDVLGRPITAGGRSSEMWVFRYGEAGEEEPGVVAGVLPDTMTLVPGVARLRGLSSADVRENDFGYTIDGPLTLEIFGPFDASTEVDAEALQVTRSSLEDPGVPPDFPAGRLTGRLDPDAVPESMTGPFVDLTEVGFSPNMYLTLGGRLALPGGEPVAMEGRVGVTRTGLGGRLRAEADATGSLGVSGADPVRLFLQRAAARYPGASIDVHGRLELFGRDLGCGNVAGTVGADGSLSANVLCAPGEAVPLAPDADRLQLGLAGVAGAIEADLTTGELPHDLTASANLRLDGPGGANCGAALDLAITNGGVSAGAIDPRCDAGEGVARLGWLAFRLSGLRLDHLDYTAAAGFDFALSVDMEPEVPAVPELELPTLIDVAAGPDGLAIPASSTGSQPAVRLAGYSLEIASVELPGFTLSWSDWSDGMADGFRFGLDLAVRMPELPSTSPSCLAGGLEANVAELAGGRLTAELADRVFAAGECVYPLSSETGLALDGIGGELAVDLVPEPTTASLPAVTGSLTLPSYFVCPAGTEPRMSLGASPVHLGPRGGLTGTVTGLSPPCPIELAALGVSIRDATLELGSVDHAQTATLAGSASGEFTGAASPVPGSGSITVDLIAGRMVDGELVFDGPFQLDLPRADPVFSFRIQQARLDTTGLHIDGRNDLLLPDGSTIGTTFDGLTINPLTLAISSGRVLFDTPFALEAAIDDAGDLDWAVTSGGADPTVSSGFRVDLPAEITLDATGFRAEGTGAAHLVYGGRDLSGLEAVFTPDFAMEPAPFGVAAGRMELRREGVRVAYVDPLGFHASFAYFGVAVVPERLGLPTEEVAYLELRDGPDGPLRVETETTAEGIRIYTPADGRVPLVFPALRLGRATAPRVEVPVDITLDELGEGVVAGGITAAVPAAVSDGFDLSGAGVPFAIDSLAYEPGSAYRFTLSGVLALFGEQLGVPGDVVLTLDGTGLLAGDVSFRTDQAVPLVPGSDRVALAIDSVDGRFDAALIGGGSYGFNLNAMGAIELATESPYRIETTVRATDGGVTVPRIEGPEDPGRIALDEFGLGVRNPRVEYLAFSDAAGWDFELLFDVHLDFPGLGGLELPPVEAVSLRPDGFRIPEYEVPELRADPFDLEGFGLTPLAFRMDAVHYDWFTGAPPSDWGFGFDLELSLAGLPSTTPAALRAVTLSVLDAGYDNGNLTGEIEPRLLGTPIEMPVGDGGGPGVLIDRLAGTLGELADVAPGGAGAGIALGGGGGPSAAPVGFGAEVGPRLEGAPGDTGAAPLQEALTLTMGGAFVLPEAMQCPAAPGDTVALGDAVLTLSSEGLISGSVADFRPPCPLVMGPLALEVTTSEVIFDISSAGQEVELDLDGSLELPAPSAGDTISAAGSIAVDLVRLRVLRGSIAVAEPFRWELPVDDPLLSLTVNEGLLDASGLHLTGSGSLALAGGSSVDVTFTDLTMGLPDFGIAAGSAGFDSAFGLRVGIGGDGLTWEAVDPAASLPAGDGLRMSLPAGVTLGADGLRADGTASAALDFADTTFATLSVDFRDAFAMGFDPVGVRAGRADFNTDEGLIAWVDSDGFHPGDLFAVVDLPERIGLPTEDVAYLVVADETGELVETEGVTDGVALRTAEGDSVDLVIPALASDASDPSTAPRFRVTLDVVVNPGDLDFVSGSVNVAAGGAGPILSLGDFGVPLDVTELAYEDTGGGYGLRLAADLRLPEAMGGLDVAFRDVTVDGSGLSGTAEVGSYSESYDAGVAPTGAITLGSDVGLELYGVRAAFSGRSATIDLAAAVTTPLFAPEGGDPEPLFFTAGVGPGGAIDATIDPPASALPVRLAEFEPMPVGGSPAIGLDVAGSDFDLTLSGRLSVPAVSDGFAVSIAGLTLGTGGVEIPDVSISTGDDPQEFELFGSTFRLQDVGGSDPAPALAFAYESRVLTATMSGELDFLENTTSFRGLSVGSDGSISIDALNLLSEGVTIVSGVLVLDTLKIEDAALVAGLEVTLPEPLDAGGPQRARFSVASDGEVTGGARIALINEDTGLGGDRTTAELGIATVHPHYVALNLSVGGSSSGAVEVAGDLYIQEEEDNVIHIGEKGGGTVDPGLVIGFDGDTDWGPFSLDGAFDFDFEAVRLTIDNVATTGDPGEFAVGLGGELSLNFSVVSGGIGFEEFVFTDAGEIDFGTEGLRGELSIEEIITLELYDLSFSREETELAVMGGDMPAEGGDARGTSREETVTVSSYFSFGGSLTISSGGEDGELFSGGVDRFLFYRQVEGEEETSHIVIQQASLKIQGGELLDARADLIYDELTGGGFHVALGATATVVGREVNLVGFMEKARGDVSAGIFVAAEIRIDMGYVTILELGGGFFYEPRPEHIEMVYAALDMSAETGATVRPARDRPDPGKFAIFLYGGLAVIDDALVRGDVLVTITQNYFAFDAEIILLNQEETIGGEAHLTVGFDDVYVEGNVLVYLDYGAAVQAEGRVEFYAYGGGTWGVIGEANVSVVSFIEISTKVFFGNPGFVADFEAGTGFDFWIVSIKTGLKTTVWYANEAPREFGAYIEFYVHAKVLKGVVAAKGTLYGALVISASPELLAGASLRISVIGISWSGSVWVSISSGGLDGGFGSDPRLEEVLSRAEEIRDEITSARDEIEEAIEEAAFAASLVGLTEEELEAAYARIRESPLAAEWLLNVRAMQELRYEEQTGEEAYYDWFIPTVFLRGAPDDRGQPLDAARNLEALKREMDELEPSVRERLSAIEMTLANVRGEDAPTLAGNPARLNIPETRTTRTDTLEDGTVDKVLETPVDADVDASAAEDQRDAMDEYSERVASLDEQFREQISAMEDGLATVRAATSGEEGSLLQYARLHSQVTAATEAGYAGQVAYFHRRQYWVLQRRLQLANRQGTIDRIAADKAEALGSRSLPTLRNLVEDRLDAFDALLGNEGDARLVVEFRDALDETDEDARRDYLVTMADSSAMLLWYHLGRVGLEVNDDTLTTQRAALVDTAGMEIDTIQASQRRLSARYDRIYASQAELLGSLYDLIDRYLYWHAERVTDTTMVVSDDPELEAYQARKDALAESFEVPRVTNLTASIRNHGYWTERRFSWVGWHPGGSETRTTTLGGTFGTEVTLGVPSPGIYEFSFIDRPGSSGSLGTLPELPEIQFLSNGGSGSLTRYSFLTGAPASISWPRSFESRDPQLRAEPREYHREFFGRVRGGAGFTAFRPVLYDIVYRDGSSITGGTEVVDEGAPMMQWVRLPDYSRRTTFERGEHEQEFWLPSFTAVRVEWQAVDPESGVRAYEYGVAMSEDTADVFERVNVGGRRSVTINLREYDIPLDTTVYVHVKAQNGAGGWSTFMSTPAIRVDTTAPQWPEGARVRLTHEEADLSWAEEGRLENEYVPSDAAEACPVPEPDYPRSRAVTSGWGGIGVATGGGFTSTTTSTSWSGSFSSSGLTTGVSMPAGGLGVDLGVGVELPAETASVTLYGPAARDAESHVDKFYYRVSTEPDTVFALEGWVEVDAAGDAWRTGEPESPPEHTTIRGPLNYADTFYVSLVAVNHAGVVSEVITSEPFTPTDPTVPEAPTFCAGFTPSGERLKVEIRNPARERESGVKGYQYRVRIGERIVRDWPESTDVDWEGAISGGEDRTIDGLDLEGGRRYHVDVRAVNNNEQAGFMGSSGPVLVDLTAPPRPTVSPYHYVFYGRDLVYLRINAPDDPQSGLMTQQVAIGSTRYSADVEPWQDLRWSRAGRFTTVIGTSELESGQTYWVHFRTVNGVGEPSRIYRTTFEAR